MRFFNREKEIKRLYEIAEISKENAQFTVVTGRRRIGKTRLLLKATEGQPTLYFFVSRKAEPFLCQDFQQEIDEFGKDYTIYFTILSSIARGDNTRGQIEARTGKEIGGYLTRLEHDYGLIGKNIPIFAKSETKNVRYALNDNYLMFWFRFVYKYA